MLSRPFGLLESLREIGPERHGILEADAEAEQAGRDTVPLPTGAAFHHARDAAEGGGVDDQPRRRLDLVRVGDVERKEAAEAGIADGFDGGMAAEPLGEDR